MYVFLGIFIALCVIFLILTYWHRRKIICKVRCMNVCEKQHLLNELIQPFGFFYKDCKDLFSSLVDAPQREYGYHGLFDRAAPRFHMVFDCEPVYFDYDGRTWMIEFWKGQYGINTGCEIGIYYADQLLAPQQYPYAQFHSAPDDRMLPMSATLERDGRLLFTIRGIQWWLTGFRMGIFSQPSQLAMRISILFPDNEMLYSFINGMYETGYTPCDICICESTVSFTFCTPHGRRRGILRKLRSQLSQLENRLFIWLFLLVTRPFTRTVDRLLYLYYFLPPVFRHTVGIRRFSHRKRYYRADKRCTPVRRWNS